MDKRTSEKTLRYNNTLFLACAGFSVTASPDWPELQIRTRASVPDDGSAPSARWQPTQQAVVDHRREMMAKAAQTAPLVESSVLLPFCAWPSVHK
ncbi:hypothetical protein GUJ93_ZPchr0001g31585 [Zizania palustris]|uniref:Uncharacterized protein n=1 Tax=Zizania palustris TaxID=103762 RepID=A0A8J5RBL5_ZIZPA|nr:hypothetical protein GUJ93_ZPchr0001g31585 [Zizania palustris]